MSAPVLYVIFPRASLWLTSHVGSLHPLRCVLPTVCLPGFGGPQCSQACGGLGDAATYGPAGREIGSACIPCQTAGKTYGFSFDWNMNNDVFTPRTISRTGASVSVDCLAEYGQLLDGSWFIPLSPGPQVTITNDIKTFAECVALCPMDSTCQFVTYDYAAKTCSVRNTAEIIYEG